MEINNAIDAYLSSIEENGGSINTIKGYRTDFNRFSEWLDGSWDNVSSVDSISKVIIRDYKFYIEKKFAPSTSNHNLIALRGLFEFVGMDDIAKSIKLKAVANQNETKWLDRSDINKLLHEIEIHPKWNVQRKAMNYAIMALLVNCGLRVAEVVDLRIDDVSFDSGLITVRNGKGNKYRRVPFGEKTTNIINEWVSYHKGQSEYLFYSQRSPRMTTRAVQHMTKGISESAGVPFTPHQGRHTYGKNIASESGSIEMPAHLLGHTNINTTRRYVTPSINEMNDVVSAIEFE